MTENTDLIKQHVLDIILRTSNTTTPGNLEKWLRRQFSLNKSEAKALIKDLIICEELAYTYQYGNTFIEKSFKKPVRVSSKIILSPPHRTYTPRAKEIVITIGDGASFGTGAHPTTRLCLRAMDQVLRRFPINPTEVSKCLDIGTGSGVLVMAAVKLGLASGLGIDMDPLALAEALQNVKLNHLDHEIYISDVPMENLNEPFFLITANLRYPTLANLANRIARLSRDKGLLVLSGFRPVEKEDIQRIYSCIGFEVVHKEEENDWACMALKKAV